jgi:hypothetical protein
MVRGVLFRPGMVQVTFAGRVRRMVLNVPAETVCCASVTETQQRNAIMPAVLSFMSDEC